MYLSTGQRTKIKHRIEVIAIENNLNAPARNFLNKVSEHHVNSCAPCDEGRGWCEFDFTSASHHVQKLQRRIDKALHEGEFSKILYLQNLLIHSHSAKMLAVKTVTSNRGKSTPGIDDVLWLSHRDKYNAALSLVRRGYTPRPLKRIYIPKRNGDVRPLSIPTMKDRAMQTLYKFALEPISELLADEHSYGFRPNRSTRDALIRCQNILCCRKDYTWVLKADVKSCFDNISHKWIMDNIPIDKKILWKFLKCGVVHRCTKYDTNYGVPQGGAISPMICNMALDGMERKLIESLQDVEFIRYADDILVISPYPSKLDKAIEIINDFLSVRGLSLSAEKTLKTKASKGFSFLGWRIQAGEELPLIIPDRSNTESLFDKVGEIFFGYEEYKELFDKLKPSIQGWVGYHRGVVNDDFLQEIMLSLQSTIRSVNDNISPNLLKLI